MSESTAPGPLTDLKAKFPNAVWTTRANNRLLRAQIPGSGLGGLAPGVGWAARVQGTAAPQPFDTPKMLMFAGRYPDGWSDGDTPNLDEQVAATVQGTSLLAQTAAEANLPLEVVDIDKREAEFPALLNESARDEVLAVGRDHANRAIDSGSDLLIIGTLGAGATTASAAVTSFTTRMEITQLVPPMTNPGGLINDAAWMRRVAALRDHMAPNRRFKRQADAIVARLGGAALGAAAGAIVAAAVRRVPVLVDGAGGLGAMMIAREYTLAAPKWCYSPDRSPHPVVTRLAKQTGMALGSGLGVDVADGVGTVLGWGLMQQALQLSQAIPILEDGKVEEEEEEPEEQVDDDPVESMEEFIDPNMLED